MPLRKSNMSQFAKSLTMVLSCTSRSLYFLLLAGGPWAQSASILFLFMFCNFLKASINFHMVGCCIVTFCLLDCGDLQLCCWFLRRHLAPEHGRSRSRVNMAGLFDGHASNALCKYAQSSPEAEAFHQV